MRSRAAVVVALLAGIIAGFGLARLQRPDAPTNRTPSLPRADVPSSAPAAVEDARDVELREVRRQLEELRRQDRPAFSGSPPPDSAAARRERAKSIFETFRRAFVDKEGPELLRALGSVDELDPGMAAFFVERHRAGIENAELRNMNLMLIHLSGGPDAAAFVVDALRNPTLPQAERDSLLQHLSGTGIPENRKLPYGGEVAVVAESLLASRVPADRMGGAGLLGGSDSDDTRVRLLRMAQSDADEGVRAAALSSLGWVGDRAAYERLKGWKADGPEKTALERALAQLKRRFPD